MNYEKSEVYAVGMDTDERRRAKMLHCKLSEFPIIYLGVSVSDFTLSKGQLNFVNEKTAKRLSTWQGDHLCSGGKSILIDLCLSSIPTYTMGVCCLKEITSK